MDGHSSPVPSRPTDTLEPHSPANEADHGDNSGHVEAQQLPSNDTPNDKTKLQDQTNLLPVKQLLIVFVGLSCALFCKTSRARETKHYYIQSALT
jgi:hypothetical protein